MQTSANPYQPPGSEVGLVTPAETLVDAGKGRRFGTFVVDYLGFMVLAFLIGAVLGLLFGERGAVIFQNIPDLVFGVVVLFVYYTFFEGLWARTPGKLVFGTRVVTLSGARPSLRDVALRTLVRFIPFEPFSFFGKTGWHDSLSKTRVVMAKP